MRVLKVLSFVLLVMILFVVGVVMTLYSSWFQDGLREHVESLLNSNPDMEVKLGEIRLKFPLDLYVGDVLMVNHGDTIVEAGSLSASVKMLPLLTGNVELVGAEIKDARYQIGAMDSASCLVIRGADIVVKKSTVKLSPMDIEVSEINLDGARVSMFINPADTFPVTPPSDPTPMNINIGKVNFRNLEYSMQLMPTIYDLTAAISEGSIDSIEVDVMKQTVNIRTFTGTALDAKYLMPDSAQIAQTTVIVKEATTSSAPWTIGI